VERLRKFKLNQYAGNTLVDIGALAEKEVIQ